MKNKNPDPPNELVEELIGYLQNSKLDKLLKRLDQLIIEYPKSGTLYNILGVYHKTTNDDDKAGKFFEKSYQNVAENLDHSGEVAGETLPQNDLDCQKTCEKC